MEYINFALLIGIIALLLIKRKRAPRVLMENGEIKSGADIEALKAAARKRGYFNLADIDCAVLEADGEISVLPNPLKRPLNPKDFNFAPVREGLCLTVAENGVLLEENVKKAGVSEKELLNIIEKDGRTLAEVRFATINEAGRVDVFT